MKCPICKTQYNESDQQCRICDFSELGKIFPTEEDAKYFYDTVIVPYHEQWNEKYLSKKKMQVGDVIDFGSYMWRVLDVQNDSALIITENIIAQCAYDSDVDWLNGGKITWEESTLRNEYLNGVFLQTFKPEEQKQILKSRINTPNNPWYNTYGGKTINDKVFLLSLDEVIKYFGNSGDLKNHKGWIFKRGWYIENELMLDETDSKCMSHYINDQYNNSRIAHDINNSFKHHWWLRSPGVGGSMAHATTITHDGFINVFGNAVHQDYIGVRPALWLRLDVVEPQNSAPAVTSNPQSPPPSKRSTQPAPRTNSDVKIGDIITFGACDWRVLDTKGNQVLIITENIVEKRDYHENPVEVTWETCDLRKYLNSEFLEKLDEIRVLTTHVKNESNLWHGTEGGRDTQDKIFLLSLEEVDFYFGKSGDYLNKRRKKPVDGGYLSNVYNYDRVSKYENKAECWLLRTPIESQCIAKVLADGTVDNNFNMLAAALGEGALGVRPALWLKL